MSRPLRFRPLELGDRAAIERHTLPTSLTNCDLAFANMYCWQPIYRSEWCEADGFLLIRFRIDGGPRIGYMQPVGNGDFAPLLPLLAADAAAFGQPLRLVGLTDEAAERLRTARPDLILRANRDMSDYIYRRDDLCRLAGRHYQPKRNHINRFRAACPDYRFEPLTPDRFDECLRLEQQWCRRHTTCYHAAILAERQAICRAFGAFEALGLSGGALYAGDRLVAFTYGSFVNHETFVVHVEKADTAYDGAFTMINKCFAETLPERCRLINREEDLGLEGLRKAKLSYCPAAIPNKVRALFPDEPEAACRRLWQRCFPEDGDDFIDSFLLQHYTRSRMSVARDADGTIVAMLHRIPFESDLGRLSYLYGIATDPARRGHGHATRLIRQAVQEALAAGDASLFLIAADEGLRDWYRRFGFEGDAAVQLITPDGFDFGTGDRTRDRALLLRLDPDLELPDTLVCRLADEA